MKKLFGLIFALLMFIGFTTVYAEDEAFNKVSNRAKELVRNQLGSSVTFNATKSGSKVTIVVDLGGNDTRTLSLDYNESEGKLSYRNSDQTVGSRDYDRLILEYLISATSDVLNQGKDGTTIINNISSYNYTNYGVEGSMSGSDVSYLTLNIKHLNMQGTNTTSTYTTNSGSTSNTNNNNKTTEKNPKTGVFVPVVGLSVLIVASVGCLVWISKKSFVRF